MNMNTSFCKESIDVRFFDVKGYLYVGISFMLKNVLSLNIIKFLFFDWLHNGSTRDDL